MSGIAAPNGAHSSQSDPSLPSTFTPICHPNVDEAVRDVDGWFLENWQFENEKSRRKFIGAGFSHVTCLYFPKALEARIRSACKLLTILFLVDDQLEYMSLEGGRAYNESLMPFCTGKVQPNRSIPVQWMMHDIWKEMRDLDNDLADDVVEPVFLFMRAQTAKERLSITDLHQYLKYRQGDVGQALLAALMRFSYDLRLSPEELSFVSDIEKNCGRHISLVNDVFSYEKEKLISEREASEGAILCNAVQILSDQVQISIEAAKKVLLILARDCETTHNELLEKKDSTLPGLGLKDSLKRYIKGLEYQMSGNELWSRTTCRYKKTKVDSEKAVVAGTPKALCKKRPLENDENERMDKTSNKHRVMSSDLIPPEPLVDVFVQ